MPTIEEARTWYDPKDPVHGFDHVLRVMKLAEKLCEELGADADIVRAAALLHDASGAAPLAETKGRKSHAQRSAEFARDLLRREGWLEARIDIVLECIRAHRYRSERVPQSLEARILFDADKLDVVGAFGVARTIGYAVQAGNPIYAQPSFTFLETGELDSGEVHSAYHEYLFKLRHVPERLYTAPARRMAKERFRLLKSFFEQLDLEASI
jgi:uncharacterized protein